MSESLSRRPTPDMRRKSSSTVAGPEHAPVTLSPSAQALNKIEQLKKLARGNVIAYEVDTSYGLQYGEVRYFENQTAAEEYITRNKLHATTPVRAIYDRDFYGNSHASLENEGRQIMFMGVEIATYEKRHKSATSKGDDTPRYTLLGQEVGQEEYDSFLAQKETARRGEDTGFQPHS